MNAPTERDVNRLFALSLNQCAFPNCTASIFGLSDEMVGEICYIKARSPEGPKYDPAQTHAERHGFNNLVLLCRNHHKIVDDDASRYPVEWLKRIKREQETKGGNELTQHRARLARQLLGTAQVPCPFHRKNFQNDVFVRKFACGGAYVPILKNFSNS
jgi:hypothetical protein